MAFKLSTESKGFDRQLIPQGTHQAVIAHMVDWGTQTETYEGQERQRRTLRIGFIFPAITHEFEVDGEKVTKNPMLSKWYTLSLDPKSNLHKDLQSILNRSLSDQEDISQILGKHIAVSVIHKEKKDGTFIDTIASFMPLMDGVQELPIDPSNIKAFDLDNPNPEVFATLGEKEQEKIKSAPEYTPF